MRAGFAPLFGAALIIATPALPQTAPEAATPTIAEAPVQLPPEDPGGVVTPGSVAAGSAAGVVIVLLGLGIVAVALSSLGG